MAEKQAVIAKRRERVIAAASVCFRENGFYHTSMAEIAIACRLSVGQIYRYFVNKDELIEAVVRDFMAKKILQRIDLAYPLETIGDKLTQRRVTETADDAQEDNGLMLEVWKEARRKKNIAKIVRAAEGKFYDQFSRTLQKHFAFLSEDDAQARAEIIAVLYEGSYLCRGMADNTNEFFLKPLYQNIINGLFSIRNIDQR